MRTMKMDAVHINLEPSTVSHHRLIVEGRKIGTWQNPDRRVVIELDDYQVAALHDELWKLVFFRERQADYARARLTRVPEKKL